VAIYLRGYAPALRRDNEKKRWDRVNIELSETVMDGLEGRIFRGLVVFFSRDKHNRVKAEIAASRYQYSEDQIAALPATWEVRPYLVRLWGLRDSRGARSRQAGQPGDLRVFEPGNEEPRGQAL
jgi:hypothetical protein